MLHPLVLADRVRDRDDDLGITFKTAPATPPRSRPSSPSGVPALDVYDRPLDPGGRRPDAHAAHGHDMNDGSWREH